MEKEQKELDRMARQMTEYLGQAQAVTKDYTRTLKFTKDPETILQIKDETLRRTAGMIYVCAQALMFTEYDITYHSGGVTVEVIHK